jgi:hypothetical protein
MIGNGHVRFGGGPLEKVLPIRNLAGGLPYRDEHFPEAELIQVVLAAAG